MKDNTVLVPIHNRGGGVVGHMLIDAVDEAKIASKKWHFVNGYAQATVAGKSVYAHRMIMDAQPHQLVDHVNRAKLDNRRSNLRFASKRQNSANSVKGSRGSSPYKGVSWNKGNRKWIASIRVEGKSRHLGCFQSEKAAAHAYDAAARIVFGEFARPNFPD